MSNHNKEKYLTHASFVVELNFNLVTVNRFSTNQDTSQYNPRLKLEKSNVISLPVSADKDIKN